MEEKLMFRYYRWSSVQQHYIVSVGYTINETKHPAVVKYALAFCGKNDSFSRKKAREVITERFEQGFISYFEVNIVDFPRRVIDELIRINYNTFIKRALPKYLGVKQIPAWAKHID